MTTVWARGQDDMATTANVGAVWKLDRIKIGERTRKRLGDIDSLMKSIQAVGLLHPVVVRPDGQLVAGFRRLKALERLGYLECEVTVAHSVEDEVAAIRAEQDENTCREEWSVADIAAHAKRERPRVEAEAKGRQAATRKNGSAAPRSGKLPEREKSDSRDAIAATAGVSGKTLEKIEAVHEAAEESKSLAPVLESMEREEKVSPAHEIATQWTDKQRKAYAKLWAWGWENSQVLKFAKAVEGLPAEEHTQARALVIEEKVPLAAEDGIKAATNLQAMPAKKRAKVYELFASDDDKERDAAISIVSGNQPTDPRVPRIVEMAQNLGGFVRRWPKDESNHDIKRAVGVLEELAESIRRRMKERAAS